MAQSAFNQQPDEYYRANARAYLRSLVSGVKPDIRPEFGRYERALRMVESAFAEIKPGEHTKMLPRSIKTIGNIRANKELKFSALLTEQGEEQASEGQQAGPLIGMPTLPNYAIIPPAVSLGACPELDQYVAFSRLASDRAYDEYHQFCGLWLFSVIAGRRVSLQIKQKKFYSNLMLSLCGATSFYAKSFTANIARKMLYELNLGYAIAPNRITPQKLLSDMAGTHIPTNFDDLEQAQQDKIRRRLGMPGQKGLLYDELGLFIQSMLRKQSTNADFADLLMTFDECPPEYENATITRGGEPIEKPYLTLLGCMTPTNLKQNGKAGADFWNDGFFARFSFVVAPPPPKDQEDAGPPTVEDDDELELPFPSRLLQSLREWHERLGVPVCHLEPKVKNDKVVAGEYKVERGPLPETACTITKEARQAWVNYEYALRQLCIKLGHEDFNGSYVRLAETAMRIAVLLASLSNNNHIELKHWAKAQELTEILRKNLHELYAQVNTSEVAPTLTKTIEDKILAYVEQNANETDKDKVPTVRNLSRATHAAVGLLQTIMIDLERAKLLSKKTRGKAIYYVPFELEDDG